MFKNGISVPGLTLKTMFDGLRDYFALLDEKNNDLYEMYKNNIVSGPSIVFHCYHEKDQTLIRPAEYPDPKPCKKIYGVDANALYLWSVMQEMPSEPGFKKIFSPTIRKNDRHGWNGTLDRLDIIFPTKEMPKRS